MPYQYKAPVYVVVTFSEILKTHKAIFLQNVFSAFYIC